MRRHDLMSAEAVIPEDENRWLLTAIRAAKTGDHAAFEEIMLATERHVSLLAFRILGDREEVKDAVQETFIRVYRHLDRYEEDRNFFAWLYRIAVNVCRDLERKRRRWLLFRPIDEALAESSDNRADDALLARADVALLTRAIDSLPRKERLAIILRDVQELPTEEVAAILGTKMTSLRVSISRARAKVRSWMEKHR